MTNTGSALTIAATGALVMLYLNWTPRGDAAEAEYEALKNAGVPMAEQCRAASRVSEAYRLDGDATKQSRWAERRDIACNHADICASIAVGGC